MKVFSFTLLFIIGCTLNLKAQDIESALLEYGEKYEAEKAYIHYDKSAYAAGETIWFKAYLMQGALPAEITKSFYLDWLDEKGNVIFHTVSPVFESSAVGQFDIPNDYKGNTIHVRGYTRWMLNFDTTFFYNKDIRILNSKESAGPVVKPVTSLVFFSEGGDAVAGVLNTVAFKATDQWGKPVKLSGVIVAGDGSVVDSIHSVHDGMGSFTFTPKSATSYSAKWKDEYGSQQTTALPAVKSSGLNLHVDIAATRPYFSITRSSNAEDRLKEGFVLATMKEKLVFKTGYNLKETSSSNKNIPVSQLPSGILTITVFDKYSVPVAERIVFINNDDYFFNADIEVQHWGLNKRARNEIEIKIPDSLIANISIAVTDEAIGTDSSENIFSTLLLTSDLKGSVNNPAYYFLRNDDVAKKHLDLVMLTNGWRRFNWDALAKNQFPEIKYPKDSSYLALSGTITGVQHKTSGTESLIVFVNQKNSKSQIIYTPISSDGKFKEADYIFFDTIIVYHQFPKSSSYKNSTIQFMPDRLPALFNTGKKILTRFFTNPADTSGDGYNFKIATDRMAAIDFYRGKTLENVTVRARSKPVIDVMDEKYSSGLFSGGDGYKFDLVNDPFSAGYRDVFSFLQGRVAGLQITGNGFDVSMQWRGGTPDVYVDEMLTDISMVSTISIQDIAFVKVFRPPFMGGSMGGDGGAIAIYTRRGDDFKSTPGAGLSRNTIMGYTAIKEFYSPNYNSFDRKNEEPDLRTTLLWMPLVLTSPGKSKTLISFFNNDLAKSFRIIVEGVSADGQFVHIEQVID